MTEGPHVTIEDPNKNWLSIWLLTILALWFLVLALASRYGDDDEDATAYETPTQDTTHTETTE